MRRLVVLAIAFLSAAPVFAQTKIVVNDIVHYPFSVDFASGSRLDLRVRSGDVRIVGVEEDRISVEVTGKSAYAARDLKVRFEKKDGAGEMKVWGGPKNGIAITVRIPSRTDLHARIPFGEVVVENMSGNQDVELHAGDLTVEVADREAYSHVDASVITGEVDAEPFGESRGGLFRSFRREGAGPYRLHAHVGAGQLTLRERSSPSARLAD